MLAYTIEKTFTERAVFERDQAGADPWGAEAVRNWEPLSTVPCRSWWFKQSMRGPAKEEVTASETVPVAMGGMLISGGAGITTDDRIAKITNQDGVTLVAGPLNIIAVLPHASSPSLIELAWKAPD